MVRTYNGLIFGRFDYYNKNKSRIFVPSNNEKSCQLCDVV